MYSCITEFEVQPPALTDFPALTAFLFLTAHGICENPKFMRAEPQAVAIITKIILQGEKILHNYLNNGFPEN